MPGPEKTSSVFVSAPLSCVAIHPFYVTVLGSAGIGFIFTGSWDTGLTQIRQRDIP